MDAKIMKLQRPEGLYGPNGWTTELGVQALLAPHYQYLFAENETLNEHAIPIPKELPPFAPFAGLGAKEAQILLNALPAAALADRQNDAPTLEQLLRAATEFPKQVLLHGYAVGPERMDERITVDGFMYYGADHYSVDEHHGSDCECQELWEHMQNTLKLESARSAPDELQRVLSLRDPSRTGWWVWWD